MKRIVKGNGFTLEGSSDIRWRPLENDWFREKA